MISISTSPLSPSLMLTHASYVVGLLSGVVMVVNKVVNGWNIVYENLYWFEQDSYAIF